MTVIAIPGQRLLPSNQKPKYYTCVTFPMGGPGNGPSSRFPPGKRNLECFRVVDRKWSIPR